MRKVLNIGGKGSPRGGADEEFGEPGERQRTEPAEGEPRGEQNGLPAQETPDDKKQEAARNSRKITVNGLYNSDVSQSPRHNASKDRQPPVVGQGNPVTDLKIERGTFPRIRKKSTHAA